MTVLVNTVNQDKMFLKGEHLMHVDFYDFIGVTIPVCSFFRLLVSHLPEIREYFMRMEDTWKMHAIDKPRENNVTCTDEIAVASMSMVKGDFGSKGGK